MTDMVPDDRARQGPKGRPVLMVLVSSLVLLALITVGLMTWIGSTGERQTSQEASRQVTDPNTTSSTNTSRTPPANPAYPAPANRTANPSSDSSGAGSSATPNGGPAR